MASQVLESPINACTLKARDLEAQLARIAKLNSAALLSHRREGLRLELIYNAKARARVLEMVGREEAYCPFLAFEVHDECDTILVTIRAPENARENAEAVFGPFQSKASAQAACACCGSAA